MANQTLTGCINFVTGLAEFNQDDCEYSGCLVIGGVHDKQVAVTIDTILCDDIYYGCVIFPGGTFEVVVPDDCCKIIARSKSNCTHCDIDTTPRFLTVTFAGCADNDNCCDNSSNDDFISSDGISGLTGRTFTIKQSGSNACLFSASVFDDGAEVLGSAEVFDGTFLPDCAGADLGSFNIQSIECGVTRQNPDTGNAVLNGGVDFGGIPLGIHIADCSESGLTYNKCIEPEGTIGNDPTPELCTLTDGCEATISEGLPAWGSSTDYLRGEYRTNDPAGAIGSEGLNLGRDYLCNTANTGENPQESLKWAVDILTWASGINYFVGEDVWFGTSQTFFRCILGHTSGAITPNNSTYWIEAFEPWISGRTYVVGAGVIHGGVNYICILQHDSQEPPNATYWVVS